MSERRPSAETKRFGRTASLLSAGVGAAGVLTYLFFSLASHNLDPTEYGEIVVLWSAVFVTISVAYRPVEQLLSRTIALRRARGEEVGSALRVAASIQLGVAAMLGILSLLLRDQLQDDLLSGSETLYWILVVAIVAFGASFYARGFLAGNRHFGLLAGLLLCESATRMCFSLVVAIGIANGQTPIALGVAAAPILSLTVVPLAFWRRSVDAPVKEEERAGQAERVSVSAGGSFAAAVLVVMMSEQAFLNAGPLLARAFDDAAAAGFIFNVLMVARAPILVFQGVATSLLPHLTRLGARGESGADAFENSIRATLTAIAGFGAAVSLIVLLAGPTLMDIAFGSRFDYDRAGLVIVAAGMGFYLAATTLSQAALARGLSARAARCWAFSALVFLVWCLLPVIGDEPRRIEVGFGLGAVLLAAQLAAVYRSAPGESMGPDSPEEIEARLAAMDEGS